MFTKTTWILLGILMVVAFFGSAMILKVYTNDHNLFKLQASPYMMGSSAFDYPSGNNQVINGQGTDVSGNVTKSYGSVMMGGVGQGNFIQPDYPNMMYVNSRMHKNLGCFGDSTFMTLKVLLGMLSAVFMVYAIIYMHKQIGKK
jgi:hypothetical protein